MYLFYILKLYFEVSLFLKSQTINLTYYLTFLTNLLSLFDMPKRYDIVEKLRGLKKLKFTSTGCTMFLYSSKFLNSVYI